jgi:hypothetical protein
MGKVAAVLCVVIGVGSAGGWYAWSELIPGPPATVAIASTEGVVLTPTTQYRFVADIRDARGRALSSQPTWSSEAAIDQRGLFTAPDRAGVYFVHAVVGGLDTTAKVTVTAGAPRTVRVLPANVTVKPRESVPFSATAFDDWGNSVPVLPSWHVSYGGGAIDQEGVFVAGTTGASTVSAEMAGLTASANATAQCVPPRTETTAGLAFTIICGTNADIWLNGKGLDAMQVTKTVDQAVVSVEKAFGRALRHRLNVSVFATKEDFDAGIRQLVHVEPSPLEEGVFVPPALIAIDWDAPDGPEAITRHEISHLVINEIASGRVPVPYWLHEGIATLNEFPVSEATAEISRYCTASAARIGEMPDLSSIASAEGWRDYVNDVGVLAYFLSAQVASFLVSDAHGQASLLEKMGGGLPVESAYAAASGRPFETFVAELDGRAIRLADGYPGVAPATSSYGGLSAYVVYGQPRGAQIKVDVLGSFFSGSTTVTAMDYGCGVGFLTERWPHGAFRINVSGPAGRATTVLYR